MAISPPHDPTNTAVTPSPAHVLVRSGVDHRPRGRPGERLHQLFEARCDALAAAGRHDHLAVDGPGGRWTYAALDAHANRLARWLRQQGVGPGTRVALLFDKSVWSYAAMLAVGKLHAAYVPLDPGFPADRIAFIVQDAGVSHLLSTTAHARLAAEAPAALHLLDQAGDALDHLPGGRLGADEAGVPADDLCYVIYTSGSTGRPKGVPIEHERIVNFVHVAAEEYGYRADDRVYQGLTLAFDFAVEEIWVPLVVGATLLPNLAGGSLLGQDLADFLREQRITALCCVPTALATLDDTLPELRWLMVSGEACPRDLVTRWATPQRVFLNAYGPTETTVTATLGRPRPGRPVTIGRPLPTYAIVVLAPDTCRALPFGEEGEIGIAGIGVAGGYLNRADQTARAFIADEIGIPHNTSGRIYRTGDLGRINADGEVEYLGRIDTQVKIRGYRIELAEIESLLLGLPGVAQAAVQPWSPEPGVTELVAYTVPPPGQAPAEPAALVAELRQHLPPYMVPAYYETLDRMPMLASDKTDRKALPPPLQPRFSGASGAGERPRVAPATPLEQVLADELAAVLGLPALSVEDHLFDDLGANSLLLARWGARLRAQPGLPPVSMRLVYGHPTVRGLAAALAPLAASAPAAEGKMDGVETGVHAGHPPHWRAGSGEAAGLEGASGSGWHRAHPVVHATCGLAQAVLALGWVGLNAAAWWEVLHWAMDATGWGQALGRAVAGAAAYSLAAVLFPVAMKWLLVGRWQAGRFPVWSAAYLRFWVVKMLVRGNPAVLLSGTPLYRLYLRLLGMRVHPSALVALRRPPVCTDLISVGPEAVLGANALVNGYRVERGWVITGPVHIGARAVVGEGALLDTHTRLGDGAVLAHASSLQPGQQVPDGGWWHGSPAVPAPRPWAAMRAQDEALRQAGQAVTPARRGLYALGQLAWAWGVVGPLPALAAYALWGGGDEELVGSAAAEVMHAAAQAEAELGASAWAGVALAAYLVAWMLGLLWVATVPRWAARLLPPGRVYRLYGWHHAWLRWVRVGSNVKAFNALFGDSSTIVHYLRAIGWRLPGLQQTGSNFGMAQQHDVPTLSTVGGSTMVSDGLTMLNAEFGAQGFQLHDLALGARCFLGNAIQVPPGHRVGDDCLLATKLMLPVDGELRQGMGLLGSPPMAIPRSVRRDAQDVALDAPGLRAQRLQQKNRANAWGMLGYLANQGAPVIALALTWHLAYEGQAEHGALMAALFAMAALPAMLLWYVLVDVASRRFKPLQPLQCPVLAPAFWRHELHWKLGLSNDSPLMAALNGTPFKAWAWRAMGAQVGRRLFDDGCSITEKSLVRLGDDCCLGELATLQGHSLEDAMFKSDRLWLGDGVTVGANAYVHYAVRLADGAVVSSDAFVMKGEELPAGARWQGNPAQAVPVVAATGEEWPQQPALESPAQALNLSVGVPGRLSDRAETARPARAA